MLWGPLKQECSYRRSAQSLARTPGINRTGVSSVSNALCSIFKIDIALVLGMQTGHFMSHHLAMERRDIWDLVESHGADLNEYNF